MMFRRKYKLIERWKNEWQKEENEGEITRKKVRRNMKRNDGESEEGRWRFRASCNRPVEVWKLRGRRKRVSDTEKRSKGRDASRAVLMQLWLWKLKVQFSLGSLFECCVCVCGWLLAFISTKCLHPFLPPLHPSPSA